MLHGRVLRSLALKHFERSLLIDEMQILANLHGNEMVAYSIVHEVSFKAVTEN